MNVFRVLNKSAGAVQVPIALTDIAACCRASKIEATKAGAE